MMRSTLGAPLGGTRRGGHQGLESLALSLITPPNFCGSAGSCSPLMVVVALGEPGVPVISWACAEARTPNSASPRAGVRSLSFGIFVLIPFGCFVVFPESYGEPFWFMRFLPGKLLAR